MSNLETMYKKQRKITMEMLHERFIYKEDEGVLIIKPKKPSDFKGGNEKTKAQNWNNKYAGRVAGSDAESYGIIYRRVMINGVVLPLHQIIWAMHHGAWAFSLIDHIDGRGLNNHISNLRIADYEVNAKNCKLNRNNKTGLHGLRIYTGKFKTSFAIRTKVNGHVTEKSFSTLFEAACFRKKWELDNGYADRHGEVK